MKELPAQIREYWSFRDEMSVQDGVILKGQRVIIPEAMQANILDQLHYGHMGIEKTKLRAKDCVYWININKDIEKMVKKCTICQENLPNQQYEELQPHELPSRAWQVLGTDMFHWEGKDFLIIADYYSKFPIIRRVPKPCPSALVVDMTKIVISELGRVECIVSDNGPHFASAEYKAFTRSWGISHKTSSPHYARSNGFVERQIRTVKSVMTKARQSNQDIAMALLCLRTTPLDHKLPSPAELLHNRKVDSNIVTKISDNRRDKDDIYNRLAQRQDNMKIQHDKHAQNGLPPLYVGQKVTYQQKSGAKWKPATVIDQADEPRSYIISTPQDRQLRRNRIHIREVPQPQPTVKKVRFAEPPEVSQTPQRLIQDIPNVPYASPTKPPPKTLQSPQKAPTVKSSTPDVAGTPVTSTKMTRSGRSVRMPRRFDD